MKTRFLLCCIAVLTLPAMAQKKTAPQVPAAVSAAFAARFPEVKEVKWDVVKGELYKAEFKVASRGHDVWIDKKGTITKYKEDFPKGELPAAIKDQLTKEFKEYKIDDADKIETEGQVLYQLKLKGNAGERKVLFTPDGKIKEDKAGKEE